MTPALQAKFLKATKSVSKDMKAARDHISKAVDALKRCGLQPEDTPLKQALIAFYHTDAKAAAFDS